MNDDRFDELTDGRRLDRGEFLRRAAAAGVVFSSLDLLPGVARAASGRAAGVPSPVHGSTVKLYCWQGYDDKYALAQYKAKYGVTVAPTYIAGDQEVFTKLGAQKGQGQWDLLTYNSGLAPQLYRRGILEPLAWSDAPNAAAIYPQFRRLPQIRTNVPGKVVGFPFSWGYQGFIRTSKLPRMTSWKQIFDPKLKGRIVGVNDPTTSIATMALALGFKDYAHLTKAQLEQVMAGWNRLRPSLRTIVSDYGAAKDLLVRGEIDGCIPGWQAMVIWAGKDGKKLSHDIPKEGVYGFLDLLCLIKGSKNPETTKAYINFMLSPEAQAHLSADLSQGITSAKAVPLLSKPLQDAYQYANLATNFKRSPIGPLPANASGGKYVSYADWAQAWDRFTAG